MARILFPEWQNANEATKYPFGADVTLSNGSKVLLEGTFLDAILHPIGGGEKLRLSKAVIDHEDVTLYIGDEVTDELAFGSFKLAALPSNVTLEDSYGRPAGLLISEPQRLGLLSTWGVGTHVFDADATEFAATVCIPTPEAGVRGFLLDDGTVLTGDVWLIGGEGVVLRRMVATRNSTPGKCAGTEYNEVLRFDVVGDPLFRRTLCSDLEASEPLFQTPRFIKTVTFQDAFNTFVVTPDEQGNISLTVNNALAEDTVLRVYPTNDGNRIEAVGSTTQSVR